MKNNIVSIKKKRKRPEADLVQKPLVKWMHLRGLLVMSIPNGSKRSMAASLHEKAMGLLPGATDLFLAMPGRLNGIIKYGYFIELKQPGQRPTTTQYTFMEKVRTQGYHAAWFDDWIKAKESIEEYLDGGYDAA